MFANRWQNPKGRSKPAENGRSDTGKTKNNQRQHRANRTEDENVIGEPHRANSEDIMPQQVRNSVDAIRRLHKLAPFVRPFSQQAFLPLPNPRIQVRLSARLPWLRVALVCAIHHRHPCIDRYSLLSVGERDSDQTEATSSRSNFQPKPVSHCVSDCPSPIGRRRASVGRGEQWFRRIL